MAAVTLAKVPVEEIQARAADMRLGRTALSVVGWVFYCVGWLVAKLMSGVIWGSIKFVVASVRVGWVSANGPSKRAIIAQQAAVIKSMEMRLSRFEG